MKLDKRKKRQERKQMETDKTPLEVIELKDLVEKLKKQYGFKSWNLTAYDSKDFIERVRRSYVPDPEQVSRENAFEVELMKRELDKHARRETHETGEGKQESS